MSFWISNFDFVSRNFDLCYSFVQFRRFASVNIFNACLVLFSIFVSEILFYFARVFFVMNKLFPVEESLLFWKIMYVTKSLKDRWLLSDNCLLRRGFAQSLCHRDLHKINKAFKLRIDFNSFIGTFLYRCSQLWKPVRFVNFDLSPSIEPARGSTCLSIAKLNLVVYVIVLTRVSHGFP